MFPQYNVLLHPLSLLCIYLPCMQEKNRTPLTFIECMMYVEFTRGDDQTTGTCEV